MSRLVSPRIIELLCSRLCHDLISPVGAVSNGLEFLGDSDSAMAADALGLVGASAAQMSSRLAFFRVAFGYGGGDGKPLSPGEVQDLITDFAADKKVALKWACPDGDLPRPQARVILCLSLLAIEALPRGGEITVSILAPIDSSEIRVSAEGASIIVRPDILEAVSVDAELEALTPRNVHGHYAALIGEEIGMIVSVGDAEDTHVRFSATPSGTA